MQPYSNPIRRNMEDDLNILKMEDNLIFLKEDNLIFFKKMEDFLKQNSATQKHLKVKTITFLKMEDNLNIFFKGRQPQFFFNGRRPVTK
jgi:hypothetical protein